jgi:transposase
MGNVVGLDVHKDTIAAACIDDATAQLLDQDTFENTLEGIARLVRWADDLGSGRVGLEPSGGVGHAAAARLVEAGHAVVLVPPRLTAREARSLRSRGKSDPTDALAIGRVVAREDRLPPFRVHGYTTDLKLLVDHRDQLQSERTRVRNRVHAHLAIAHPGYQRDIGRQLTSKRSLDRVDALVAADSDLRAELVREALSRLRELDAQLRATAERIDTLIADIGTTLTEIVGISNISAARILGEIGDVSRFPTSAAFAANNGTAPIPASSGRTERHRLNRGGNRRLNRALYFITLTQSQHEPRAIAYLDKKRAEGKTRREAIRCLKRRLSDVVYRQLVADATMIALDT